MNDKRKVKRGVKRGKKPSEGEGGGCNPRRGLLIFRKQQNCLVGTWEGCCFIRVRGLQRKKDLMLALH